MGDELKAIVECHSGFEYAERPTALHWQGERLEIAEVEAQWRVPEGRYFRVRIAERRVFELFYDQRNDEWKITEL